MKPTSLEPESILLKPEPTPLEPESTLLKPEPTSLEPKVQASREGINNLQFFA